MVHVASGGGGAVTARALVIIVGARAPPIPTEAERVHC